MLQRIQSIWLLLAAGLSFLTLKFSFFSGNKLDAANLKSFVYLTATSSLLIMILTVAVLVASLICIFLYKTRKLQLRIVLVSLLVSVLTLLLYYQETKKFVDGTYSLSALAAALVPLLLLLAARGIYKDEKLVKSMDRLR